MRVVLYIGDGIRIPANSSIGFNAENVGASDDRIFYAGTGIIIQSSEAIHTTTNTSINTTVDSGKALTVEGDISASGVVMGVTHITASGNISGSGTLDITGTTTLGETVLVGNAIQHTGDTDTKLNFTDDQLVFTIGNDQVMTLKPNVVKLSAHVTAEFTHKCEW